MFVGAAFSRDRFNSRLKAAPTGVFIKNLDFPDKRNNKKATLTRVADGTFPRLG